LSIVYIILGDRNSDIQTLPNEIVEIQPDAVSDYLRKNKPDRIIWDLNYIHNQDGKFHDLLQTILPYLRTSVVLTSDPTVRTNLLINNIRTAETLESAVNLPLY
jgi:hypothetical protein